MNTLQLIKARTTRTRAMQRARLQMAKAFGSADHTDATHTPLGSVNKPQLRYRGVAYNPVPVSDTHLTLPTTWSV